MPTAREDIVVNTGPLIALGRIGAFDLIAQLPIRFLSPQVVADEVAAGTRAGHPVVMPPWVTVQVPKGTVVPLAQYVLDEGEAAVIDLAIERGIADVCIDEWRGRRAAVSVGLRVTGSLGLLGRAKRVGIVSEVLPWVRKLASSGVHYHPDLLRDFLVAMGEPLKP